MVIQRVQSLLLLVAAVVMAWFSCVTVGQVNTADFTLNFFPLGFEFEGTYDNPAYSGWYAYTWSFFILGLISAVIPFIAIFSYRNLKLQMRLCLITCLLLCATVAVGANYGYNFVEGGTITWNQMAFAPLLAFCAAILAWTRIRSDKRRIEAADRIR
ncbi:MAG: DUF4293 domain-containing protein [Bacteroides sp.]|nr:DUF4293 domain-containing protein [Bacteroides sp.]